MDSKTKTRNKKTIKTTFKQKTFQKTKKFFVFEKQK